MAEKGTVTGLILEGSQFEGKLSFRDRMCINGDFQGEISSDDQLIVGKNAHIDAKIKVGEMIVRGEVKGKVTECDRLSIENGGRVLADVRVRVLDIQSGAVFNGKCAMIREDHPKKMAVVNK